MSTNYYFRIDINTGSYQSTQDIHIGQYSANSCLLMRQDQCYKTVEEMHTFYNHNKEKLSIVNEYDLVLTWEELQNNLLSQPARISARYHLDSFGYAWSDEPFC
ncbi:hypothetical protein [Paenibacillus sp. Leaf72]|uniref:hypothetical protein n=1 Tax=Paenibacillus sp. Leaf72 TaxID=1736234 RepID=UPI0006FD295D|nr:hypothetical protein [Paenibacillus sp. Leaf72]KQN96772.1 hypothetical protein ASF12_22120 [Paenibacillus sp. Leaf72]